MLPNPHNSCNCTMAWLSLTSDGMAAQLRGGQGRQGALQAAKRCARSADNDGTAVFLRACAPTGCHVQQQRAIPVGPAWSTGSQPGSPGPHQTPLPGLTRSKSSTVAAQLELTLGCAHHRACGERGAGRPRAVGSNVCSQPL